MEDRQIWIEQMVSDVSSHALRLDETRLQSFLGWLEAHSSRMQVASQAGIEIASEEKLDVQLKDALKGWFESLPIPGLLWEYHLLLNEIAWRREPSRMMKLQGGESHVQIFDWLFRPHRQDVSSALFPFRVARFSEK